MATPHARGRAEALLRHLDAARGRKLAGHCGPALFASRRPRRGFGDFAALGAFAAQRRRRRIDALASARRMRSSAPTLRSISPYAPSTRLFLDPLYADAALPAWRRRRTPAPRTLIDWPASAQAQMRAAAPGLRHLRRAGARQRGFRAFAAGRAAAARSRALRSAGCAFPRKDGKGLARLAAAVPRPARAATSRTSPRARRRRSPSSFSCNGWRTDSADAAQARARRDGWRSGLIADMAVGHGPAAAMPGARRTNCSRSDRRRAARHLQSRRPGLGPDRLLAHRLAPPVTTASSPPCARPCAMPAASASTMPWACAGCGLCRTAPRPPRRLSALSAARTDAPDGAGIRVAHSAMVIGEDLGTVPEGFREQLAGAGMLGMRVLWFERGKDGRFMPPTSAGSARRLRTDHHPRPADGGGLVAGPRHRLGRKLEAQDAARRRRRRAPRAQARIARDCGPPVKEAGCAEAEPPERARSRAVDAALGLRRRHALPACHRAEWKICWPCRAAQHSRHHRRTSQLAPPPAADDDIWPDDAGARPRWRRSSGSSGHDPARHLPPAVPQGLHLRRRRAAGAAICAELGISHLYASPILTARAGSMHGYDVVDHAPHQSGTGRRGRLPRAGRGAAPHGIGHHRWTSCPTTWRSAAPTIAGGWMCWRTGRTAATPPFRHRLGAGQPACTTRCWLPFLGQAVRGGARGGRDQARADGTLRQATAFAYFDRTLPLRPEDHEEVWTTAAFSERRDRTLHALLERQHYRPGLVAHSRRRASTGGASSTSPTSAALRRKSRRVRAEPRTDIRALSPKGLIDGVRIDHVDGLADPAAYCRTAARAR